MAIEFHCPYCTAAIRVPDAAAGKRGTCPKCATKLLVPAIEIPETPVRPAPGRPHPQPDVFSATPTETNPDAAELPGVDVVPPIQTNPVETRSRRRGRKTRRKRRRSSGLWVVIPLAVVALLVAGMLFVFYQPPEKLEGTLTGKRVTAVNITPAKLTSADVDADIEDFAKAVALLKADPLILTSELVRTEIRGDENAIEVSIKMTATAEFVAVDVNDRLLKQYVADNELAFGLRRVKKLRDAATQLVVELSREGEQAVSNPSLLRNAVALNLLRRGFGFVVEGAAGNKLCPCVYESGDQIWFAIPAGTTSFVLHGRTIGDMGKLFPGRYEVTVSGTSTVVPVAADPDGDTTTDVDDPSDQPVAPDEKQMGDPDMDDAKTMNDGNG